MPIEYSCSNGMEGVEVGDNILLGFSPCSRRGWSSNYRAQHHMHWTAGIVRRFKQFAVVKFILSLWHSLASRQ